MPISAQAGTLDEYTVSVKENECERIIVPIKGADWVITISGDSMTPEYHPGSQILIKKINEPEGEKRNLLLEKGGILMLSAN